MISAKSDVAAETVRKVGFAVSDILGITSVTEVQGRRLKERS
jgi:hypothetical protein